MAADVQDALADADALGNGHVISARIDRESGLHGCASLPGGNLDHPAAEVAVFGRRNAGNDLDGLDVLHLEAAGIDAGQAAEGRVVAHPDAVHFHGGAERGVARARSASADGQFRCGGEVRIDGLATGHQGRDIRQAGHLQVVQGRPFDLPGGVEVVLGHLGRDDDLVQGERLLLQDDVKTVDVVGYLQFPDVGHEAQAFRLHLVGTGFHALQDELSVQVRDRPEVVLVQMDDGAGQGGAGSVRHPAADTESGRESVQSRGHDQQYEQKPFQLFCKGKLFSSPAQSPEMRMQRPMKVNAALSGSSS